MTPEHDTQRARDLAAARGDWHILVGTVLSRAYSEAEARAGVDRLVTAGHTAVKLLQVIEDYDQ